MTIESETVIMLGLRSEAVAARSPKTKKSKRNTLAMLLKRKTKKKKRFCALSTPGERRADEKRKIFKKNKNKKFEVARMSSSLSRKKKMTRVRVKTT